MKSYKYPAFSGFGVEVEYMIVDETTLNVMPVADKLLDLVGGAEDMDVDRGAAAWSNELALHVIEVKTSGPTADFVGASDVFHTQVKDINALLGSLGAKLMPGGMHPWMDPLTETRLWPHQNDEIYAAFDRIFNCRGHGWSNLQSTHINFPFSNPSEFEAVHAACRFVLPLVPVIAASSPYLSGKRGPALSTRLSVYEKNCARIPSVSGKVIPERLYSEHEYLKMLAGIYRDLRPFDPEGDLAFEWVNARGCIARFDRGAIEIRLLDAQECPAQDFAVVAFVSRLVRALAQGEVLALADLKAWPEEHLLQILHQATVEGRAAAICPEYASAWANAGLTMGALLTDLIERFPIEDALMPGLRLVGERGPLAERLVRVLGSAPTQAELEKVYGQLCDSLRDNQAFDPQG